MAGELVTETFSYGGERDVTVYVPARPVDSVVYCGDGQLVASWGADVESTMVVGVHCIEAAPGDDWPRIHEYSPDFKPDVFAAHEAFLMGEVRDWVTLRFGVSFGPDRTAIAGWSASGELALALGMRHPDVFGAVFCASPGGGYQPPADVSGGIRRAYFVGGTEEPWFYDNAKRWADALEAGGADVVIHQRDGNHGDPFWRAEFPLQCAWAFGDRSL